MHRPVFSSLALALLSAFLLGACSHNGASLEDTSAATINVKTLSAAQSQQTQDLLAIKDLAAGETTGGSNGASYEVIETYHAASGALCKKAIIKRTASSMTGFDTANAGEKIHACYKGDLAFLPSSKLR